MVDLFDNKGQLIDSVCEHARQIRDPNYDGVFFICVRTTGIYCRPVCRVKLPLAKNVTFAPSAAAAERSGYRPCLRCRPESAPGSAAWRGTEAVVNRGLAIIEEAYLDSHSTEELAARLGIGSRHLCRLFQQYTGATPLQVAATRRLHLANRLISDTDGKFSDIAFESGYGSVRRFNDIICKVYRKTPSALRKTRSFTPMSTR